MWRPVIPQQFQIPSLVDEQKERSQKHYCLWIQLKKCLHSRKIPAYIRIRKGSFLSWLVSVWQWFTLACIARSELYKTPGTSRYKHYFYFKNTSGHSRSSRRCHESKFSLFEMMTCQPTGWIGWQERNLSSQIFRLKLNIQGVTVNFLQ